MDERISLWLEGVAMSGPVVGSVLSVIIASVGLGMTTSAFRWAMIDQIHALTGLRRPHWSDRQLHERIEA